MVLSGYCNEPGSFMSQVSHKTQSRFYLRSEQAYTLHKPARYRFTNNYTYVARSMLSASPTWPICRESPGKTAEWGTFSLILMYFPKSPGQSLFTPKTLRQSRRLSGRGSQPRTHATLCAYRPTRVRNVSTRTSKPWWNATVSSTLPVSTSKRQPW